MILVERIAGGWPISRAARAAGMSRQTGSKWWHRYRAEGAAGLLDRSSAVRRQARAHEPAVVEQLCRLRRTLKIGPHRLAWRAGLPRSPVYAVLRRHGLSRLDRLEPRPPIIRYERAAPGALLHLDTKSLGRIRAGGGHRVHGRRVGDLHHPGLGGNRVHVAIDDHSRIAYSEELADELPATTVAFLRRAVAFYAGQGIWCAADPDRQRQSLSQPGLRGGLRRAGRPAPPHSALPAADGPMRHPSTTLPRG